MFPGAGLLVVVADSCRGRAGELRRSAMGMFSSRLFRDASATCNFSSFPTGISLSDSLGGENRKINLICFALTSGNIAFLWKARHIVANDRNRREMREIITTTVLPETGIAWK